MISTMITILAWIGQLPWRTCCFVLPFIEDSLMTLLGIFAGHVYFYTQPIIWVLKLIGLLLMTILGFISQLCIGILALFTPNVASEILGLYASALARDTFMHILRSFMYVTTQPYFTETVMATAICGVILPTIIIVSQEPPMADRPQAPRA